MENEEGCSCCSMDCTKSAEDKIRDMINWINVKKEEEFSDVTTRIDPATAKELVAKLEELAQKIGECCE